MLAVHRPSAVKSWMGVILGAALILSTSACGTGTDAVGIPLSSPAASTSAAPPTTEAAAAPATTAERADDIDATVCSDAEFGEAATIPDLFSDLNIPFYACTHEMEALTGTDPLFVGAYVLTPTQNGAISAN